MTRRAIVVPLDGSSFAEWALPVAMAAAEQLDADLQLITVYFDDALMAEWEVPTEKLAEFHRDYVTDAAERVGAATRVNVTTTVLSGDVGAVLQGYIAETEPLFVVMSTHGRGPASRAWLGSVADFVLRHVHTSMILVRPPESGAPVLSARPAIDHVLVALDGSPHAEAVLPPVQQIARAFRAKVTLLQCVPPQYAISPYLPDTIAETQGAFERGRAKAAEYLESIRRRLASEGLEVATGVTVGTPPGSAIVKRAVAEAVDLVAVATHGRRGVRRIVLGSVADKVVRAAPVPVLVTRP